MGVVDKFGVSHKWAFPIIRHTVVAEAIDMELIKPMLVDGKEEWWDHLPVVVDAGALVIEVVLSEWTNKWILVVSEPIIKILIREECPARMTVDGIHNDRNPVSMRVVNKMLELVAAPEALVDPEVTDWQIAPIHLARNIRDRHDAEAVDTKVSQIIQPVDCTCGVHMELGQIDLIHHQIIELRCPPVGFAGRPRVIPCT